MPQILSTAKKMILQNGSKKAMNFLIESIEKNTLVCCKKNYDELILLSSQLKRIDDKIRSGIIGHENELIEKNKIDSNLLNLINCINDGKTEKNDKQLEDIYFFSDSEIRTRINNINNLIKTSLNENLLLDLGVCYLKLGLYDMSLIETQKALRINSSNPRIYFYMALALFENKPIKSLSHSTARIAYQYIRSASLLDKRREFEMLSLILKIEYFKHHGLNVPDIGFRQHIKNLEEYESVLIDFKNLGRYANFNIIELKSIYQTYI